MTEPAKKSGLAKAATIFAVGLGISLGLCGANFALIVSGSGNHLMSEGPARTVFEKVLMVMAWLELAGIAICAAGLLVVGVIALFQLISPAKNGDLQ